MVKENLRELPSGFTIGAMPSFNHLHAHSYYSFLEGLPSPADLAETAARFEMKALALTDRISLSGGIEFYLACQQAVDDQLAREQQVEPSASPSQTRQAAPPAENMASQNGNGSNRSGNGASNGHQASEKQMTYIQQLSRQIRGLGVRRLEALASRLFSKPLATLTSFEASSLIDTLKAIKAGEVDLETALNGAAQ